jgi:hypothetical protein
MRRGPQQAKRGASRLDVPRGLVEDGHGASPLDSREPSTAMAGDYAGVRSRRGDVPSRAPHIEPIEQRGDVGIDERGRVARHHVGRDLALHRLAESNGTGANPDCRLGLRREVDQPPGDGHDVEKIRSGHCMRIASSRFRLMLEQRRNPCEPIEPRMMRRHRGRQRASPQWRVPALERSASDRPGGVDELLEHDGRMADPARARFVRRLRHWCGERESAQLRDEVRPMLPQCDGVHGELSSRLPRDAERSQHLWKCFPFAVDSLALRRDRICKARLTRHDRAFGCIDRCVELGQGAARAIKAGAHTNHVARATKSRDVDVARADALELLGETIREARRVLVDQGLALHQQRLELPEEGSCAGYPLENRDRIPLEGLARRAALLELPERTLEQQTEDPIRRIGIDAAQLRDGVIPRRNGAS